MIPNVLPREAFRVPGTATGCQGLLILHCSNAAWRGNNRLRRPILLGHSGKTMETVSIVVFALLVAVVGRGSSTRRRSDSFHRYFSFHPGDHHFTISESRRNQGRKLYHLMRPK